jgi:hypothetical protein
MSHLIYYYADCRALFIILLNAIMLSVDRLSVIILGVVGPKIQTKNQP